MAKFTIKFAWDDEAYVWMATSDDFVGLVLEDGSLDVLMYRVRLAAPEMLELNHGYKGDAEFDFVLAHQERLVVGG
ncbi:MAG: DUF1902 domain-containing protein [Defluviitaleaceae bacterium]|nr:DUF1902 domain-containing protein [Defluviitaleaceae bacterium]